MEIPTLKVAYLVNQYPKISHTFIRREILALEDIGIEVVRTASRKGPEELVDQDDKLELEKTLYLLSNRLGVIFSLLTALCSSPIKTTTAFRTALSLRSNCSGSFVRHMAYLAQAAYLSRLCKEQNIAHVHAHFGTSPAAIALLCKLLGGPGYSFTVHGPEEFDDPKGLSLNEKISNANAVLAITSFCKSQLSRWCAYEHWEKIRIVHCALGEEYIDAKPVAFPEHFSMLSIGRLCEQKGQMVIVEALRRLSERGITTRCNIVGDGELRAIIESKISEYGLSASISILGWKSSEEIRQLIDDSSLLLLPSFAEGLPVVIMESLARARPTITTYIAGIPELIEDESNGWIIPAGDPEKLSSAIEHAMKSPKEVLEKMGAAGRASVQEHHDVRKEADKLKQIFLDCI